MIHILWTLGVTQLYLVSEWMYIEVQQQQSDETDTKEFYKLIELKLEVEEVQYQMKGELKDFIKKYQYFIMCCKRIHILLLE